MNTTELGFSAFLAAFIILPGLAKLSAEALDGVFWLINKALRRTKKPSEINRVVP